MPTTPSQSDQSFFAALLAADAAALDRLLTDDFILIDVMRGGEILRAAFIDAVASRQVVFERIEPADIRVRLYGSAAIVSGRTSMSGRFAGQPFSTLSRYTHVYIGQNETWRLASAQGTPIAGD